MRRNPFHHELAAEALPESLLELAHPEKLHPPKIVDYEAELGVVETDGIGALANPVVAASEEEDRMAYVLAVRWVAKEGEEENVLAAIRALAEPSRAEPGCLMWQPHRDPDDPRVFFIYEQYTDPAAYEAHGSSQHFQRHALEDAIPRLEARERTFYETL